MDTAILMKRLDQCAARVQASNETPDCKTEVNVQVSVYAGLISAAHESIEKQTLLNGVLSEVEAFCRLVESTFPSPAGV